MYNKLFYSILDSSVWLEPVTTRIVWITLLAAMDEDGFARFASIENLAARARVSMKDADRAVSILQDPDPNSSNPANEGRRIERVQGGWMVLNAKEHRDLYKRELKREQNRVRVQNCRAKKAEALQEHYTALPHECTIEYATELDLPKEFQESAEFTEAWQAFVEHRKTIKAKLTPRATKLIGQKLKQWGLAKAILALNNTVESGKWTGVFDPDERKYGSNGKPKRPKTDWSKITAENAF
jgi:hypothetical protein